MSGIRSFKGMMMRSFFGLLAGVVLTLGLPLSASAATYVAASDYTGTQNAAGVWTYGQLIGGNYSDLTASGGAFIGPDSYSTPLILQASSTQLLMHPGQYGELVDLRFTAPTAGTYLANFSAYLGDSSCGSCDSTDGVTLYLGSSPALLTRPAGYAPTLLTNTFTLAQNQTINFAISANSNYNYDTTLVSASVTAVPEPATWVMLLLGFGGIGFLLRSGRRERAGSALTA